MMRNPILIINYLTKKYPFLEEKDIKEILRITSLKAFNSGDFFIKFDENNRHVFFVLEGLFKAYYYDKNHEEVIIGFYKEDDLAGDWYAALSKQPAQICIQALEAAVIIQIDTQNIDNLIQKNVTLLKFYNDLLQKKLVNSLHNIKTYLNEKPKARYLRLLEEESYLLDRVPQKQIAHYLGITPVSLSRKLFKNDLFFF